MAKNYTFKEAVDIIAKGADMESIADLGRRYPILAQKVAVVATKAGKDFVDLMGYMPDYLTANKVNAAIKASISGAETSDEEDEVENTETEGETPKSEDSKKAKVENTKEESGGKVDYNKFNGDTLIKMCKEKGIYERGMKKAALVKALEDYDANGGADSTDEEEGANTETEETENPYKGKSAVELFKECKKRGIKAVPKKPAKFYIDLLLKDDEAKAEAAEDEDDDWGDEEDEAPVEKKAAPKATAKGGKTKATKKVEVESDDDDDWDI